VGPMSSEPLCAPFQYLFIPVDKAIAPSVHHFNGKTDEELRSCIGRHFQQTGISVGQSAEFKGHLQAQVDKQMKDADPECNEKTSEGVLDTMLSSSSTTFEIVPVVYPQAHNGFIGTSLYIDQVGVFKELPLNDRASKIAQRPIRGDAFLLRCYDNPDDDDWRRLDCTLDHFEELHRNPPSIAPDPTAQAAALQAQLAAAAKTKDLTPEMVEDAQEAKEEGNEAFKKQDYKEAFARYSAAVDLLGGRCPDHLADRVRGLLLACRLNRGQCHLKLEKWTAAVDDCSAVLEMDPTHPKALFRRATAYLHLGDFEAAQADLTKAESKEPSTEITKLQAQVRRAEADERKRKQQQFSKLFA
jgi:hypothetical protein